MNGSCQKVWCMSVKKVPYITPWPLLHMAWNRLDRLLFLKKSMDNNPKQHEPSYWELSFSCYCNSTTLPSSTSICWQYSANTVPDETYGNLSKSVKLISRHVKWRPWCILNVSWQWLWIIRWQKIWLAGLLCQHPVAASSSNGHGAVMFLVMHCQWIAVFQSKGQ